MRAIVLSGGGAKGAYQLGVWKALRKLHISYDIVTGTSIGAMNGMFLVQKEYRKCYQLWNNIDFNQIYDDFKADDKLEIYKSYFGHMVKGGLSLTKIEKLIDECYSPKKLYRSKIQYGIVAMNISTMKPVFATKQNTKPRKLRDYIMASATCFPVFATKKIDNQVFIDGGYYDNMPINLAFDLGADEVIAVDLDAIGMKRKVKDKDKKITVITPTNKIESFLMFEKNATREMIKFGYNDTMKKFHKLEGEQYTFRKGALAHNCRKYKKDFLRNVKKYVEKPVGTMKKLFHNQDVEKIMAQIVEDALDIFGMDATVIYNSTSFNKQLRQAFEKVTFSKIESLEELKQIINRKIQIRYIYDKIKQGEKINYAICNIFRMEVLIALYLFTLQEG